MIVQCSECENQHKVVLLGDSRVGKTSLLCRQLHGFQPPSQTPTIGCHCSELSMDVDGKTVTLQVWDTAGQEMYRALVPVYLRGADVALIIYDITDMDSFQNLSQWFEQLADTVPQEIPVFIIGNKIDLNRQQMIDDEQAKSFANRHHARFTKTSAVTGEGVEELFKAVAKELAHLKPIERAIKQTEKTNRGGCC